VHAAAEVHEEFEGFEALDWAARFHREARQ